MEPQILNLTALNVDNNTPGKTCKDFFNNQKKANDTEADFASYAGMTQKFRDSDATTKVGAHFFTSGYILKKEEIDKLLKPTVVNGIKFYLGIDNDANGNQIVNIIAVGTFQEDDNHMFSDFNIPKVGEEDFSPVSVLAEPRPCPKQCGTANVLNPDPEAGE